MRVLHVIPSLDPSQGGPSTVMPQIAKALVQQGLTVDVACVDPIPTPNTPPPFTQTTAGGYRVLLFGHNLGYLRFSWSFFKWINEHARDYDVIHVHGVLTLTTLIANRAAIMSDVPLIVRTLGILNRWGMENRKAFLKKIWFHFLEKPLLDRAASMHFTSQEEDLEVGRLGIQAPAVVLPLGLDMRAFENMPDGTAFRRRLEIPDSDQAILFLSRIHLKKGIELLFHAFAALRKQRSDIRLIVAGDGDPRYVETLKVLSAELGISDALSWTGFLGPTERLEALAASQLFCLPSNSENFGIALLEAMASGLPCISSPEVALAQEPATLGSVDVIPRDAEKWTAAMASLLADPERARALGARAIKVCREHYSTEKLGMNLSRLYSDLTSKQSEPKSLPIHTPSAASTSHQSIQETAPSSVASRPTASSKSGFLSQITPVILTWNEGPNLGRCLDELSWADQIIVLDSGSTDNTAAIAARYPNVQWHQRPFDTHTEQWNHAIDLAPTPWALTLDADYVLNADLVAELNALAPPSDLHAFEACFRYCVFGSPLRSSLYPPRALLFRRATCRYIQDGHTQLLDAPGTAAQLKTPISHDDRKPLSRWIVSQDKYAILETAKLLSTNKQDLRLQDRLRCTGWAAVPATVFYTLFVRRTILDGWRGWYYTLQRTIAEIILALRLLEKRLDP